MVPTCLHLIHQSGLYKSPSDPKDVGRVVQSKSRPRLQPPGQGWDLGWRSSRWPCGCGAWYRPGARVFLLCYKEGGPET